MKRHRLLLTVMLVWACACKTLDPYVATGELLHTTAREVVEVGTTLNAAYDAHTISKADYDRWADFLRRFKPAYAIALATWDFAQKNSDALAQGRVRDSIIALAAELSTFTPLMVNLVQEMK